MKFIFSFWLVFLASSSVVFAQDPFTADKTRGLQELREIQMTYAYMSGTEPARDALLNALRLSLLRNLPELKLAGPEKAEGQLMLEIRLGRDGAYVRLSVIRKVVVMGAKNPPFVMAPVWFDDELITGRIQNDTGQVTSDALKELLGVLDKLVTRLAADYLTANPPRR